MACCAYCEEKLGRRKLFTFSIYWICHEYWSNILTQVPETYDAGRILK